MSDHRAIRTQEQPGLHRFLRCFYWAEFWYDFIFAYAIYTVYFSLRGMSVFDISLLITWWSISAMALEVPSGALADVWSRKYLLVLSPLIKALCFVTWFFAGGSFWLFALGFLLWSVGGSLRSGTQEALLYDTLVHYGKRGDYERVLGTQGSYFHVALAISMVLGGFLASYRISWVILFSVVPLLLSALAAWRLEEVPKAKSTVEVHYVEHLRLALHEVRHNRALFFLVVCLWLLPFGALEEFDQLFYQLVKLPLVWFGVVSFAGSLLCAAGARAAYRMKGRSWPLVALPLAGALLLALVWAFPSQWIILLLLLAYALAEPVGVLLNSRMQHAILGVSRATVTSALALLLELPQYSLLFGVVARARGIRSIYLAGAGLLVLLALWAASGARALGGKGAGGPRNWRRA